MSTAKPFADHPTHASQSNADRSRAERQRGEAEPARSPYAPKRVRGGFMATAARTGDEASPPGFLLSTKRSLLRERGPTDFPENSLQVPDERSLLQRSLLEGERRNDELAADFADDEELRRLEASVRELQREIESGRTRGSDEPPAAQYADAKVQRRQRDTYIEGFRVPPSLEPEILSSPLGVRTGRSRMRTLLGVSVASLIAAPIAYYFAIDGSGLGPESAPETTLASVESQAIPVRTQSFQPPGTESKSPAALPESKPAPPVTVVPRRAATPPAEPPRTSPPSASANPTPPPRVLDPGEIEVLVKQGQQFVAAGDFVTARMVFQRAAEAGNAVAALALGASYDPVVLTSLGVRNIQPDVSKARTWYQKAKDLGAPEANRRLTGLANR